MKNTTDVLNFIKELYGSRDMIPLHEPKFIGREKEYLLNCIDSTFVSSVGNYILEFEKQVAEYTGFKFAIATTNGTTALHTSLILAKVIPGDEVLTQALTFVATANSIAHASANPVFIDSAKDNLGMCPEKLEEFLSTNTLIDHDGNCINKISNKIIRACVPMHVFGHVVKIEKIQEICNRYNIFLIEDSAEALGTFYKGKHVGHHGKISVLSFNGNKTITCGGGGMILTNDENIAKKAKHITTTAKVPHSWEFFHDEVAYNYRLPNLNAALAVAQMENLVPFLKNKRETAMLYNRFFDSIGISYLKETPDSESNFWLYAILAKDRTERDDFLKISNGSGVMTRPIWTLMNKLPMYKNCQTTNLENAEWFEDRIINIPSSVRV
jgi:aminotransferase in exopolysaccharide biosynthesis